MDLAAVRRIAITAMFADDYLMECVVLKGGNALSLIHCIGQRASLDLDFSIETDFPDPDAAKERIFRSLQSRFDSAGYVVFDKSFQPRPTTPKPQQSKRWGGYQVDFKLIERSKFSRLNGDLQAIRRDALVVGPAHVRTFTIDLSRYEYCAPKQERTLDDFLIYVYSPEMIASEKLRAICQQMPEYPQTANRRARARDFYDIVAITSACSIDFADATIHDLVRNIFGAKEVPLCLLPKISTVREFHRSDWPKVEQATARLEGTFDDYFDFVVAQVERLEPLWVE